MNKNKFTNIFAIIVGIFVCTVLLFWCGRLSISQGKFVQQDTQLGINLLLLVACVWLLGFIIYKVVSHEKSLQQIQDLCKDVKNLTESNNELLQYIIQQSEMDFCELIKFNSHNREILLKMYEKGGVCKGDKTRTMEREE